MSRANGTVPELVRLCVHTTEPTGPVPEPFHCDHIARWSARSRMTGRSGTGVNTGNWNGCGVNNATVLFKLVELLPFECPLLPCVVCCPSIRPLTEPSR